MNKIMIYIVWELSFIAFALSLSLGTIALILSIQGLIQINFYFLATIIIIIWWVLRCTYDWATITYYEQFEK